MINTNESYAKEMNDWIKHEKRIKEWLNNNTQIVEELNIILDEGGKA